MDNPDADSNKQRKNWLIEQLKKPVFGIPLLLLFFVPLALLLSWDYWFPKLQPPKTVAVEIATDPAGATILLNDKEQAKKTNAKFSLAPGKYGLTLKLPSHQTVNTEIIVRDKPNQEFHFPLVWVRDVVINSIPDEALVSIKGQEAFQKTPARFQLPVGMYSLELSYPNYQTKQVSLEVVKGKSPLVEKYTLDEIRPTTELVELTTKPPGAEVFIDGVPQKQKTDGEYQLLPGKHELKLVLDERYKVIEKTIDVKAGKKDQIFHSDFELILKSLVINSKPPEAEVYFNDDKDPQKGKTNGKFLIPIGKHEVTVKRKYYEPYTQSIVVTADEAPEPINAPLSPLPERRFALLIGIHQPCPQLPDFLHAEADVMELGHTLALAGYDKVVVLTQHRGKVLLAPAKKVETPFANKAGFIPTATSIRQELDLVLQECTEADHLLVGLIGHQIQLPQDPVSYFAPANANLNDNRTLVPMNDFVQLLQQSPLKSKILIQDGWRETPHPAKQPGFSLQGRPSPPPAPEVLVISGCQTETKGFAHNEERRGAFMNFVIVGLQGGADKNEDRKITTFELAGYLQEAVPDYTQKVYGKRQLPEVSLKARTETDVAELKPSLIAFHEGIAFFKGEEVNLDKAIGLFGQTIGQSPLFAEAYIKRAEALYFKGQQFWGDAQKDCEDVLQFDPWHAMAYHNLGVIQLELQQFAAAEKSFKKAIQLEPAYAQGHNLLAQSYARQVEKTEQKEYKLAVENFQKAIDLAPKFISAYENRAYLYFRFDKLDEAIADLDRALEVEKGNKKLYMGKGLAHFKRGRIFQAEKDFKKACDDFDFAIQCSQSALKIDADYENAQKLLKLAQKEKVECQKELLKS